MMPGPLAPPHPWPCPGLSRAQVPVVQNKLLLQVALSQPARQSGPLAVARPRGAAGSGLGKTLPDPPGSPTSAGATSIAPAPRTWDWRAWAPSGFSERWVQGWPPFPARALGSSPWFCVYPGPSQCLYTGAQPTAWPPGSLCCSLWWVRMQPQSRTTKRVQPTPRCPDHGLGSGSAVSLIVSPPQRDGHIPTPDTCDYGLLWKWGLCRCDEVKTRPDWSGVARTPVAAGPMRIGSFEAHRERPCEDGGREEGGGHEPSAPGAPGPGSTPEAPGELGLQTPTLGFRPWL